MGNRAYTVIDYLGQSRMMKNSAETRQSGRREHNSIAHLDFIFSVT